MSKDETAAIVKHIEHTAKIKENFSVLEDDAITKAVQISNHYRKLCNYFTEATLRTTERECAPTFVSDT